MNTLGNKISEFVAAHKKFPTAVDLRKTDHRLWEELTPEETAGFILKTVEGLELFTVAFKYWLYWLQAVRFKATNELMTAMTRRVDPKFDLIMSKLTISRLKFGRRALKPNVAANLLKLYLLSVEQRKQLKQEVLNSNGTTTV
jgi:hypothetical protein